MRATDRYAALNRRARHDYLILDTLEAGLVLHGTEVKVLRQGGASIAEAYADEPRGEAGDHRFEHRRGEPAGIGVEPRAMVAVGEHGSVRQRVHRAVGKRVR